MDTGAWYRWFAAHEAAGSSPTYERLALAVARETDLLEGLDRLPPSKRQPNLLFAAATHLGAPMDVSGFVAWVVERWDDVEEVMTARSTQTNEAARTSAFLPLLAAIDGPITLVEVGTSAGLCLYPDRYAIAYDDRPPLVDSPVEIPVATAGPVPIPDRVPEIVVRVGIDLHPLDVADPEDVAWLRACIWPEHEARRRRLDAAVALVSTDPPRLVAGDLVELIGGVLAEVDAGTTPVVVHSAVLGYLLAESRAQFASQVLAHPKAMWISNEGPGVVDGLTTDLRPPASFATPDRLGFLVGVGGATTVALSDPHGAWLTWAT